MTHRPTNAELVSIYAHRHVRGKMSADELWMHSTRFLSKEITRLSEENRRLIQEKVAFTDEVMELKIQLEDSLTLVEHYKSEAATWMMRNQEQKEQAKRGHQQLENERREYASSAKKTQEEVERLIQEVSQLKSGEGKQTEQPSIPKISTLIFNNKYVDGKHYLDQSLEKSGEIIYMGQKKGRNDPYIIPNQTLYLDRSKNDMPYVYRGLITHKEIIEANKGEGATYKLTLDTSHIHLGIHSGQKLPLVEGVPRGRGKYCLKNSCLRHLQMEPMDSLLCGILRVKSV